jgi:Raf kinase inhibitor-like YbhB/YbcL family protein
VEVALVLEDPDAPGEVFFHWVVWGLDPAAKTLAEGALPAEAIEGANSTGQTGYMGPCPPPGPAHRYRFVMYALSKPVTLEAGATADELLASIRKSTLAKATLVGRFGH